MSEANAQSSGEKTSRPARRQRRRGRKRPRPNHQRVVPLHKRASSHFNRTDRQRGSELVREGRVHLDLGSPRTRARINDRDGKTYGVGVDWSTIADDRTLHAFCQCQRFSSGKVCKHLWALLLLLADKGQKEQPPGTDQLALDKDGAAAWPELGGGSSNKSNKKASNKHETAAKKQKRQRRQRVVNARGKRSSAKVWRDQVDVLHDRAEDLLEQLDPELADHEDTAAEESSSASGKELPVRFAINTSAEAPEGGLVLDLFRLPAGTASGKGQPKPKAANVDPEDLRGLLYPDGVDAIPFVTALPAEPKPRPTRSRGRQKPKPAPAPAKTQIQRMVLPQAFHADLLPELCRRGDLGWWDGRVTNTLQLVSWDSGPAWRLALRLEVDPQGVSRIRGLLQNGQRALALEEARKLIPGQLRPATADGARTDADDETYLDDAEDTAEHAAAGDDEYDSTADDAHDAQGEVDEASSHPGDSAAADDDVPDDAFVLFSDRLSRFDCRLVRDLPWIELLREKGEVVVPQNDLQEALTSILELPDLPPFAMPEELQLEEEVARMRPSLVLEADPAPEWMDPPLLATLSFRYGNLEVSAADPRPVVIEWPARTYLRRDLDAEHAALVRLLELGPRPVSAEGGHALEVVRKDLAAVAEPLLAEGWEVEVHGTSLRRSGTPSLKVESTIDWFELSGGVDFAGQRVDLSEALAAISRGERFIELADGTQGLLPQSLADTYDSLAKLAHEETDGGLRFLPAQALLVDALLTTTPPQVDGAFAELRENLRSVEGIKPKKELKTFEGTLRGYQREGLGWLAFLREFGLGGVLADDMGLGKTVQVLALIHSFRTPRKTTGLPFLVVAPRSLVYNWLDETARFTPKMRVLEYSGPDRESLRQQLPDVDLVVTTYATLRRDIAYLTSVEFDTVILDEAQAIKNRDSQSAKASRLLVARNRLALTGTPIENHLGELGSIFEFLNPGLFGRLPKLDALTGGRNPSKKELQLVAEGIRPFILRRTKAQVLPDLPPKTELTLHCTLRPEQRELYDQLRQHYQANLMQEVKSRGVGGKSFQVLEALLRLRQVACHPGLVKEEWAEAGSAKLEILFDHVTEVLEEGHKVIVFSQFTKLLGLVRDELDDRQIQYAYLDGQTRNRGEVVESFQTDPDCNLFLISIKAGGVGLNLTAAGYVFLLDPWWNPAVEAQAIDRAHRLGQTHPVFAYRLIAQDTVEEKILQLQSSKRALADAILEGEGDGQMLRDLTADDLELLLS